jgi:hypothetical protein
VPAEPGAGVRLAGPPAPIREAWIRRAAQEKEASENSRELPRDDERDLLAMSTALSPMRSIARATSIIDIAHSRRSASVPISTVRASTHQSFKVEAEGVNLSFEDITAGELKPGNVTNWILYDCDWTNHD